jgi:folylpolyglutamate synthase/dihydropteroate synthase
MHMVELNDLIGLNQSSLEQALAARPRTSYFEVFTALAIQHFAKKEVDWAIMEAGLGGVSDATNVFRADQVS